MEATMGVEAAAGRSVAMLRAVLDEARATPRVAERLGRADVVAAIEVTDLGSVLTLVLQDGCTELRDGTPQHADVTVEITTDGLAQMLAGAQPLGIQIAEGTVAFRGPVRRLLRVEPILRAQAQRLAPSLERLAA